jgi:hypothetical protein
LFGWAEYRRIHLKKTRTTSNIRSDTMNTLTKLAVVLTVLWAIAFLTGYTLGGAVHFLLIAALVSLLIQVIRKRKMA